MFPHLRSSVAVDLGTANVLVHVNGRGIVLREPSIITVRADNRREITAVGEAARQMAGRSPEDVIAIRPLKDGVIADIDATEMMLQYFLSKALQRGGLFNIAPDIVICVPCGVTDVEKRAVMQATYNAGAHEAMIAEEPLAAALGAGLPVTEPVGSMIVDIGGGTSEVAVISLGGIAASSSLRVGGVRMDEAVISLCRKEYNLLISEQTAEDIKINLGSAIEPRYSTAMQIKGLDLATGDAASAEITTAEVYDALREPVSEILEVIRATLEKTPPELAADVMRNGITLAGGGAMLQGLELLIYRETGISASVAQNPMDCVALGAGRILQTLPRLRRRADAER
jgi:rod shape-determining protein MreB